MKEDPVAVLRRARQEAIDISDKASGRALYRLLRDAEDDLAQRLAKHKQLRPLGDGTFTRAQMEVTLRQIREVTQALVQKMGPLIEDAGEDAAYQASEGVAEYLRAAEERFGGIAGGLALDEAAMTDAAIAGTRASVARRLMVEHPDGKGGGVLQRYGFEVMRKFERELSVGVVTRKPFEEIKASLVEASPFLKGAPASWAERLTRTELMGSYNRGAHASMQKAQDDLGDMVRILVATFDDRTAGDSYNVHGEVRSMSEPFEYVRYDGEHEHFMTPPNRPNDREVVVAHRTSWPVPQAFLPKSDGEVQARYAKEKRKYHGRPHVMSTVKGLAQAKRPKTGPRTLEEQGIEHELSPEVRRNVEAGIHKGGFEEHLRRVPLSGGIGQHEAMIEGPDGELQPMANGLYWKGSHAVSLLDHEGFEVRHERTQDFERKRNAKREAKGKKPRAPKPGPDVHSISSLAADADEMQQRTTVHELGHHVHLGGIAQKDPLALKIDGIVKEAFDKRIADKSWMVSKYAKTNHKEWFAETHAARVYHPQRLKKKDPEAAALIRRIRKMRGMDP